MSLSNFNILLVEDDESSRLSLLYMLEDIGVTNVHQVANGQEACDFIQTPECHVNLIISDWNMPKMSGLELLCKTRECNNMVPFIMITGRADVNSLQDALTKGVNAYIRKPFTLEELSTKLQSIYKRAELF